jgi:RNA recognition motif-containing protein
MGFGFVKFSSNEEATSAITHLNCLKVNNKVIKVSFARPPSQDIKDCKLFATDFPMDFDEIKCRQLFSEVRYTRYLPEIFYLTKAVLQFGKIIELRYVDRKCPDGNSRAMAFVQYDVRVQAVQGMLVSIMLHYH